jgi:glutaredoxin
VTDELPFPAPAILTVYGADWCGDCRRAKSLLAARGTPHEYVDLLTAHDAQRALQAAGILGIPVVAFPDGRVLIDPPLVELEAALEA